MKTKRKQISTSLDNELKGIFNSFCASDEESEKAIRDAKRAFPFIKQDVLYNAGTNAEG